MASFAAYNATCPKPESACLLRPVKHPRRLQVSTSVLLRFHGSEQLILKVQSAELNITV
jgi:hypothetical protein